MPRFSIIIPVYNVEKYIKDCLESIRKQTCQNFEVIIVNDGTLDNSQIIIDEYVKMDSRFKSYTKENGGQSSARNYGVLKSNGEYIIFVDSDDYIEAELLEKCNDVIGENSLIDIIRFQTKQINIEDNTEMYLAGKEFSVLNGEQGFKLLLTDKLFDSPCLYAFKKDYWILNDFTFVEGRIHEDFGLIPYVVIKAKSIVSINYFGYVYMVRQNSVMTNKSENHINKRVSDMFFHYDNLIKIINSDQYLSNSSKKLFKSFLANAMLNISTVVLRQNVKDYKRKLTNRHISDNLLTNTLPRKIKKIIVKYNLSLYLKILAKRKGIK